MAAAKEPHSVDVDAEPLVFKPRLNGIPKWQAITNLMPTIVNLAFTLKMVWLGIWLVKLVNK